MPRYEESSGMRPLRVIAGEGMLMATLNGFFLDQYGRHEIKAGITRVSPDHPLAKRRPEAFRVAGLRGGEAPAPAKPTTTRPAWWSDMAAIVKPPADGKVAVDGRRPPQGQIPAMA